ncbi:MAG: hypothetical protein KAQ68_07020 [Clostridiales bacterium]|nr:hypothetical protein [Clostridiales bacterium]
MLDIDKQLKQIHIKSQPISNDVMKNVILAAASKKKSKARNPYTRKLVWALPAVALVVAAMILIAMPNAVKDLTISEMNYYTVDINPGISIQVDDKDVVIETTAINDDGKQLLKTIDLGGLYIDDAIEKILRAAKEMGYLNDGHVVVGYFGSGKHGISMDKVEELAGKAKTIFLMGTREQYEDFVEEGLHPGLELLYIKGEELGITDGQDASEIVAAIIKLKLEIVDPTDELTPDKTPEFTPEKTPKESSETTPDKTPEPTPDKTNKPTQSPGNHESATISGEVTDNGIRLNWSKVDSGGFTGYKVVASKTNPNPKYPDDGYLYYITNRDTTTVLVPFYKLKSNTNYYFSITALYDGEKVAGNAIMLKTPHVEISYEGAPITGYATEEKIVLDWMQIDTPGAMGYKVVASKTDSTPSYPENGYIEWITNLEVHHREYAPSGTLVAGETYWFAITVVYEDGTKITENSIQLTVPSVEPTASPTPHIYEGTTLAGSFNETGISLSWTQVDADGASGYKVVASSTDSTPSYPENGYIEWITNLATTSRGYEPSESLLAGETYWIAITVVYGDGTKVTSNVIQLTMPAATPSPTATPRVYEGTTISGSANDTHVVLNWGQVDTPGAVGYKVVASSTDSSPSYPENGAIEYITSLGTTSREYAPSGTLVAGETYWFAITVLYDDDTKATNNAIQLTMPNP